MYTANKHIQSQHNTKQVKPSAIQASTSKPLPLKTKTVQPHIQKVKQPPKIQPYV